MNLELKHLAPYLPYKLKFSCQEEDEFTMNALTESNGVIYCNGVNISNEKPLLRPIVNISKPLSDATIPIIELAKICEGTPIKNWNTEGSRAISFETYGKVCFELNILPRTKELISINKTLNGSYIQLNNPFQLFEYLFKNHFDVFNLIDQGLAVPLT